jgi:hypothetical protein
MRPAGNIIAAYTIAVAALPVLAASAKGSDAANIGGVAIVVPEEWRRDGDGAWVLEGDAIGDSGKRAASLVVTALPRHTDLTRRELEAGRLALGFAAREHGLADATIELVAVSGTPAYRVRATRATAEDRVEQVQYIVSGKSTVALTFSCAAEEFEAYGPIFESIARSIEVREKAGILDQVPASLCCAALGIIALLGIATRRRRLACFLR